MKNLARFFVLAIFVLVFATCASAQVTWTFNDVMFTDGVTVTGNFTTNSAVNTVESFDVTLMGPGSFTVNVIADSYLPTLIGLASDSMFTQYLDLYLSSPMTGAGGTIAISSGFNCPILGGGCQALDTAADPTIMGAAPEPSTGGLMLLGFALLLGTRLVRRSRRTTTAKHA